MKKVFIFVFFFFVTFINVYAEGNYITAIKIDQVNIEGFESSKTEYKINVDSNKSSIVLDYEFDKSIYTGDGSSGTVSLDYGENKFSYTLKNNSDVNDSKTYTITVNRPDNRSSDNSLKSLKVGTNQIILGNESEWTVSVDEKVTSVEVTASLNNSKAAFVNGYGERTVNLTGETTTFEIKVKAENGSVKTYKVNVKKTKSDVKSNDATLKSLKIDGIDFDFKSNTLEYDLSVKYNITTLKINAVPNSAKATVDYKETIILVNGLNETEIKVKAEDGTEKIYKLKITREDETYIISNIQIDDVHFKFDPKVYTYKIITDLETLNFDITLGNEKATYEIIGNENLKDGSVVKIEAKDQEEIVNYTFNIVNKVDVEAEDVEITTETDESFFQKYEMIISLAIFGLGLLAMLFAILLKPKQ